MIVSHSKSIFLSFIVFVTLLSSIKCNNVTIHPKYRDMKNNSVNYEVYCSDKNICITKCCLEDSITIIKDDENQTCISRKDLAKMYSELGGYETLTKMTNLSSVEVYKKGNYEFLITNKTVNHFNLIFNPDINLSNENDYYNIRNGITETSYILMEDGYIRKFRPNYWYPWKEDAPQTFCMEYRMIINAGKIETPFVTFYLKVSPHQYNNDPNRIKLATAGMLVSCFFMVIVLIVYALLPELHGPVSGKVLMSTVINFIASFLTISLENLLTIPTRERCIASGVLRYYTHLVCFFWMTVMFFDIWRTFRRIKLSSSPRVQRLRFTYYAIYAWGTPLLMTALVEILDYVNLKSTPSFIRPHLHDVGMPCFFAGPELLGYEKAFYMYIPTVLLITVNIILYGMTVYNIHAVKRNIKHINDSTRMTKKAADADHTLSVYLKLSAVTGVTWIADLLVYYLTNDFEWFKYIIDIYNMLTGVIIFFIYVFKKDIMLKLMKRYECCCNNIQERWPSSKSTKTTSQT